VFDFLGQMMAPILPHMAEDIWLNLPYTPPTKSVFQGGWGKEVFPPHREEEWQKILALRGDVNKCTELARRLKIIGSSLETKVKRRHFFWCNLSCEFLQ